MGSRQITCPTCSHAFAVSADARTAICPRCGKALPILSSGISLDFEMPIPKKKAEKHEPPPPPPAPPPPPPQEAKLARISLRKAGDRKPTRGFEDLSAVTKPAGPKSAVDLPPAPEATIPGDRGFHVEILPRGGGRRDSDAATGVDLPMRPRGAFVDPSQYQESGVGADEPTAVPHDGGLITVESGEWPGQEPEQVVNDDTWSEGTPIDEVATSPEAVAPPLPPLPAKGIPPARTRPAVPPARRAPPPPAPPRATPPPPLQLPSDDPKVTAMRLKAIDDEDPAPEVVAPDFGQAGDLGGYAPPDLGPSDGGLPDLGAPDLGAPDLGGPLPELAPPDLDGAPPDFGGPPSDLDGMPTEHGPAPVPPPPQARSTVPGPLGRGRTASFHRDLSPSQRVAALTDAIDDEVSREIPLNPPPPQEASSGVYPPPQTPGTMTNLGLGPEPTGEDGAPLVLPDTGIMVFVPDMPIEERSLGEEKPDPTRYKTAGTVELAPVQQRRKPLVAGGHGVATRRAGGASGEHAPAPPKRRGLLIAVVVGSVVIALAVGLVLFLR